VNFVFKSIIKTYSNPPYYYWKHAIMLIFKYEQVLLTTEVLSLWLVIWQTMWRILK